MQEHPRAPQKMMRCEDRYLLSSRRKVEACTIARQQAIILPTARARGAGPDESHGAERKRPAAPAHAGQPRGPARALSEAILLRRGTDQITLFEDGSRERFFHEK